MIWEIAKFKGQLGFSGRILGLDWGEKRIGAALSDTTWLIASAYAVYEKGEFWRALPRLIEKEEVGAIIIGSPLTMAGRQENAAAQAAAFAEKIDAAYYELPIAFWDERLSSQATERHLIEDADLSRAKRAQVRDKLAAAYILQGALDYLKIES